MDFRVRRCFRGLKSALKTEISEYYATIFSRKAGAPICIALCVLTIVSYAIAHL